jgi:hypothetical protein
MFWDNLRIPNRERREDMKKAEKKCGCRKPKTHRDCMYCGSGYIGEYVCGVCREAGIDGAVIRGTERRMCAAHRAEYEARVERETD